MIEVVVDIGEYHWMALLPSDIVDGENLRNPFAGLS
jgi:hypothetical protein